MACFRLGLLVIAATVSGCGSSGASTAPESYTQFCEVLSDTRARYKKTYSGPDYINKDSDLSTIQSEREHSLAELIPTGEFAGWPAELKSVNVFEADKTVSLTFEFGCKSEVFSVFSSESALVSQVADLKQGQSVSLSGVFALSESPKLHLAERSFTESGRMDFPEYTGAISAIEFSH